MLFLALDCCLPVAQLSIWPSKGTKSNNTVVDSNQYHVGGPTTGGRAGVGAMTKRRESLLRQAAANYRAWRELYVER